VIIMKGMEKSNSLRKSIVSIDDDKVVFLKGKKIRKGGNDDEKESGEEVRRLEK